MHLRPRSCDDIDLIVWLEKTVTIHGSGGPPHEATGSDAGAERHSAQGSSSTRAQHQQLMEAIQQQQQAAQQQQVQMQQMQQQDEERKVDGIRNLKKTLKEDQQGSHASMRAENYTVYWRATRVLRPSTIAKSVTGLEGVEAWSKLHVNYCRRTVARIVRVQRERVCSKPATHVSHARLAITQ